MTTFFKYIFSVTLVFALIGCQNDSPEETSPQSQQSQQPSQQQDPLGQMQKSAPEVDLSDEEAATFADAAMAAQKVQIKAQQKMMSIIEKEGLDVETYQKIAQSQQMGQGTQGGAGSADSISESDMEKFKSATQALKESQAGMREKVAGAVEDEGMKMQRFREISRAAQHDTALQQQLRQEMQKKMSEQRGQRGGQKQSPTEQ